MSKEEFFDHQEELDDSIYNNLSNKAENSISQVRKAFSRIRHGDPFLKEIDYFIEELQSMNNWPALELNDVLTEVAKKNFIIS